MHRLTPASAPRPVRHRPFATLVSSLAIVIALAWAARAEVVFDAPFLSTSGAEAANSLAAGDLNGDGKADLVSPAWYGGSNEISINLGLGNGRFAPPVDYDCGTSPLGIAVGDLNGDGKLDVVTVNDGGTLSVLLGNGDGTVGGHVEYALIAPINVSQPFSVRVADLNGDGRGDVIVTVPGKTTLSIFPGNADGTVGPRLDVPLAFPARVARVGDFDRDGKPDLLVDGNGQYFVLPGHGDFSFGSGLAVNVGLAFPYSVGPAAIGDLDGDGKLDLAFREFSSSTASPPRVGVCLGRGDGTFGPATHSPIQTGIGTGLVEIGDFDGDGKPDVAAILGQNPAGGTVSLLRGHGDGTFDAAREFAAIGNPTGSAVVDVNGDGRADLALAGRYGSTVGVLLGNASGGFGAPHELLVGTGRQSGSPPQFVVVGDVNHDGVPDLATVSGDPDSLDVLLGDGGGGFPALIRSPLESAFDLALADLDGDGIADLVTSNQQLTTGGSDSTVTVHHGNGDGTFGPGVRWFAGRGPEMLQVADVNGDGHADLIVLYGYDATGGPLVTPHAVAVLLGNGDGTFQAPISHETGANTLAFTIGDLNRDGHPDIAASSYGLNSVVTLLGNGDGTFTAGPSLALHWPGTPALGDINGDGVLDLAIDHGANGLADSVAVLLGAGDGSFAPHLDLAFRGISGVVGLADFDQDGHLDLAVVTGGWSLSVWTGHGDGSFSPPATDFGLGSLPVGTIAIADLNGDHLPDVIAANTFMSDLQVLMNRTVTSPTAVLASLVSASATPAGVHVVWAAAAGTSVTIERSEGGSSWSVVGHSIFDGSGLLGFDDAAVTAGHRYGYRLVLASSAPLAEVWVDVPLAARLALAGITPNPSSGDRLLVSFSLPSVARAQLQVFDLAGRRIVSREVGGFGIGSHQVDLARGAHFAPGLYLLRLRQGGRSAGARVAVIP